FTEPSDRTASPLPAHDGRGSTVSLLAVAMQRRQQHAPRDPNQGQVVGIENDPRKVPADKIVPFHPQSNPPDVQFQPPAVYAKRLLESYARHITALPHPDDPEKRAGRVKIYRVVHLIPSAKQMASGIHPCAPTLYLPFYVGEYDTEGKLTQEAEDDPLLYWVVPILLDQVP